VLRKRESTWVDWGALPLTDPVEKGFAARRTAHLTVSDFCRERLPGGPCTHWKALTAGNY
jgi:hypothetical protein